MCGIVGIIGKQDAAPVILKGLKRLEYRGYDSAGISIISDSKLKTLKQEGKIKNLEALLAGEDMTSGIGIGHTRWATHGEPSNENAHPHESMDGSLSLVHNGIIENYESLKKMLMAAGFSFKSETDSEVLSNLIQYNYHGNLMDAVITSLKSVVGAYGIAVIHRSHPGQLVCARFGSPLVIGVGEGVNYVASDAAAFIDQTNTIIYLADGEISVLSATDVQTYNIDHEAIDKTVSELSLSLEEIEKGGYEHFMLKEIHEQPRTIRDAMRGRLLEADGISHLGGISPVEGRILWSRDISITACGTSWHAALIGQYLFEEFVHKPVNVDYASEFRYRHSLVNSDSVVMVISQSGETADTLAALRLARERGALTIGIVNSVGSTIARETDAGVYVHAGPEIGVASTKAFTSQVTVLALIALKLGRMLGTISLEDGQKKVQALLSLERNVQRILENTDLIRTIAGRYKDNRNFLYLGRGYQFPVALEGALKLKEISYIHAEGYPAAEMKHGPIALIDENMPVVVIATRDKTYDKILSNIQEVKARKGSVIAIANEGDTEIAALADYTITIPETEEFIQPILSVIPLQLLSYYIAVYRGCNVDQPRNLAKSVTVE